MSALVHMPTVWLDVTRLLTRVGRGALTGIDRVELAYLHHLAQCPEPLFAVARSTLGYVLLGSDGITRITQRIDGALPWGMADRLSKLARSKPPTVRQAESDLRRFALDRREERIYRRPVLLNRR